MIKSLGPNDFRQLGPKRLVGFIHHRRVQLLTVPRPLDQPGGDHFLLRFGEGEHGYPHLDARITRAGLGPILADDLLHEKHFFRGGRDTAFVMNFLQAGAVHLGVMRD